MRGFSPGQPRGAAGPGLVPQALPGFCQGSFPKLSIRLALRLPRSARCFAAPWLSRETHSSYDSDTYKTRRIPYNQNYPDFQSNEERRRYKNLLENTETLPQADPKVKTSTPSSSRQRALDADDSLKHTPPSTLEHRGALERGPSHQEKD